MSDRMDKIHEFAEEARKWDIEHGRKLERERIIDLLDDKASFLVAKGDMGSPLLVFLGKFVDQLEGESK